MKKRILSMMLVLCMVLGMMPVSAFAAEGDNLCDHHTAHTADCGYAPAVEGSPCTHECGEECAEACTHAHDELCGYVEAAAEVPCGYVCEESHGGATRVIYVDESTFLASGYSNFYDANENLLTTTREEQEDGWVKYTMPADAKYYLTFDGHLGGGGGGDYPELPTNADTYDPVSDIWSCSHPGYAEGNCRLCGAPCPGHTYQYDCDTHCSLCGLLTHPEAEHRRNGEVCEDCQCAYGCGLGMPAVADHDWDCYFEQAPTCGVDGAYYYECTVCFASYEEYPPATGEHEYDNACDMYCNVCSEVREVPGHVYDNACDASCNVCSASREVGDHVYDNACDASCNNCDDIREVGDHVYDNACDVECNVCYFVREGSGHVYDNACDAECNVCSEIREVGDHVYDGAEDAECNECGFVRTVGPALITGMSITIDGVVYDSSNTSAEDPAVITPNTGFITITVHGTALQNCTTDHMVSYYSGSSEPILPDYLWRFEADGTGAYHYYSSASALSDFARNTTPYELQYSNNGSFNAANPAIGSGVYIVYDDSTGGEEDTTPAEITGVTVTVDGETHTSGNVTITPTSTITLTVTGTNLQNGTDDNRVNYADGFGQTVSRDYFEINEDGTTATDAPPVNFFANSSNFEIKYYNNYTDIYNRTAVPTGIYLTYDDGTGGEEDTTPDSTGKILVDMQDSYGDGWNGAAIDIYKNGSLEQTVTVDKTSNTVFLDYDSTATYEFKWIKGDYDYECSFTIYEDGEEKLSVTDASVYENGETIWPQGDTGGEEDTTSAEITGVTVTVDGVLYTSGNVTITPTSTIIFTVTGTNFANLNDNNYLGYYFSTIVASNAGFTIDTAANTATRDFTGIISQFEECDDFEVMYSNDGTQSWIGTGIYLTYDDGTGEEGGDDPIEPDTTPAEITGVSITVDGETYTEGDVTITPTSTIIVTVTGTHFANLSGDHELDLGPGLTIFLNTWRWEIDSDANTATADFSDLNSEFVDHNGYEITYSNGGGQGLTGTGIYLTYDDSTGGEEDTTPDSTGKILVDMQDSYGDGWNDAAIQIYKNGSLEQTVTVDKTSNTVFLDYDSTATYEFKWIKGGYDSECRFTIYVDGEEVLTVSDASVYEDGQTLPTQEAAVKELAITKQPTDSSAKIGERYCVTVEAEGEGLTYQWYIKNAGATKWSKSSVTDNTYDDVMTAIRAGREVKCVITDAFGNKVTSDIATLIGIPEVELQLLTQPNDASAKLGETFCVAVEAQGDGLKYQWYYRQAGTERWQSSGVRDNTYDDAMTSARHNRQVYCVITDAWGNSVTTDIATITGTPEVTLEITRTPVNQTVTLGDNFHVDFEAQGDGLRYQWYFRKAGTERWLTSAQKDNSYDDVMTAARHNRELKCVVTDAWGNQVETSPVVVIMATQKHELQILQQPNDAGAKLGEEFCVTVEAQGDGLKYQWYWRNAGTETWKLSGQRDNTYDDVMTAARHNREVKCVITDMWGNQVETEVATITGTATETLAITQQPTDATAALGERYCVTVEATGDDLRYQWYFRNAGATRWSKSGVTDNTYDDVMTNTRAGREVYCVITDAWGGKIITETVKLNCIDTTQEVFTAN